MDFQPYYIYEDTRVLGSISKASRCWWACVCMFCGLFSLQLENTNEQNKIKMYDFRIVNYLILVN